MSRASNQAVHNRHVASGPHVAERPCLGGCGQPFRSEGPWNRICPKCARANAANPETASSTPHTAHMLLPGQHGYCGGAALTETSGLDGGHAI